MKSILMLRIVNRLVRKIKSAIITYKYVDSSEGEIVFEDSLVDLIISKSDNSKLLIDGKLRVRSHLLGNSRATIILGPNATLHFQGDFVIGQGVRISVGKGAYLSFGGRKFESESGITCDSIIMVNKRIEIGCDFLCSWNVFITDSDWHTLGSKNHQKDVVIGDHVWVANSVNILKGSEIGSGSVIASQSKTANTRFEPNTLIGGSSKVIRQDIFWSREIG